MVRPVLFEYWDFYARNVEEAWNFLNQLAQDTYVFEISCANSYNPLPCILDLAPPWCETQLAIALIMIVRLIPIIFFIRVFLDLVV